MSADHPSSDRPINLYVGGWHVDGRFARHRCRDCGCETEPGTVFSDSGHFGSNESWPTCARCKSANVDLIVSYSGPVPYIREASGEPA